jgi:hypothetical protein
MTRATPLPSRTFGLALSLLRILLDSRLPHLCLPFFSSFCLSPRRRHRSRSRSLPTSLSLHTSACGIGIGARDPSGGIRRLVPQTQNHCCCLVVLHLLPSHNGEYDAWHRLESGPPRTRAREVPIPTYLLVIEVRLPLLPLLFAAVSLEDIPSIHTQNFSSVSISLSFLLSSLHFTDSFSHPHLSLMRMISSPRLTPLSGQSAPAKHQYQLLQ